MSCWSARLRGPETANQSAVAVRQCVYTFGGKGKQIDVHVFNPVTLIWTKLTPVSPGREGPSRRFGYTAVLIEDTVYVWGGYTSCRNKLGNIVHAFDVDSHRWLKPQVSGTVPLGRSGHSACVLEKAMFIHGGYIQLTSRTNGSYKLDTSTMVWSLIKTRGIQPPVSECHSATIIGTKMFVFGGWSGHPNYNTTVRVFDTETYLWLNTPSTQHLDDDVRLDALHHSAFAYNGELYIFGGIGSTCNEVWTFSPETFSWKKVEPKGKGPSLSSMMRCCVVGDRSIVFGGHRTPAHLYILDLSPTLKTLCKLAVIQYGLTQSGLPHNIRWELTRDGLTAGPP